MYFQSHCLTVEVRETRLETKAKAVFLGMACSVFDIEGNYFNYLPSILSALLPLGILKVQIFSLKAML